MGKLSEKEALRLELAEVKDELKKLKREEHIKLGNIFLDKVKKRFMKKGISEKWLDKIFDSLIHESMLNTKILKDERYILAYILEEMDKALEIREESLGEKKIIMFVGATGVGKTTMIAKLSARYAYTSKKKHSIGFLNLDNFKIGAFDQLKHFAEVMDIKHLAIESHSAFMSGLKALQEHDIIFIDTAGMSPYDTQKFIRIIEFMQSDIQRKLEVNLVLPATVKSEDMDDIYKNFSFLNLHSVIISKFDETKHLGALLNFMLLYEVPMSYFSIGQEVPDDVILASKEYLLERFIGNLDE
ncbi:Flagellar biosynthesis protein FlhF [hydrothermal vent metagenome]|uniref:Flagellar biosynthesis protein FlhF n=1 Tax=hydrothermal vent metagenome TaxID=652676 RepID=A0A1W1D120_9ZZZZ